MLAGPELIMWYVQTYHFCGITYCVLALPGGWILMAWEQETGIECSRIEYDIILDLHQLDRRRAP